MSHRSRPSALFVGSQYAGHATRFASLREHVARDGRLEAAFHGVSGWNDSGRIERSRFIPAALKRRLRPVIEAAVVARVPRPNALWTSCREELVPYVWAQYGPLRRPLVLDLDATDRQLESMAEAYFGRPAKAGIAARQAALLERLVLRQATAFTPWSGWAAQGLVDEGVDPAHIRVVPPGADLARWRPARRDLAERPLRVLFVGGDFVRKGGDLLVEAARRLDGRVELTLVTRDDPGPLPPGARTVRATPNSTELRQCFAEADVFAMPTRAECFGIAFIEAMAAGLPVIAGDVGGVSDIVEDGKTGWLIEPSLGALLVALEFAVQHRTALAALGARGRERAERLFDGARNDRRVVDLMLELVEERHRGG